MDVFLLLLFLVLLPILVPLVLVLVGWLVGSSRERAHLESLDTREGALRQRVLVTQLKTPPPAVSGHLVVGQAVIASDYFKMLTAQWRALFGGELKAYQPVMERARREALVRALDQAVASGNNQVVNVRFTSHQIGRMAVEVLCFATAVRVTQPA